ncbi:unnamed protein product [Polarella glacialis]|uniref:Glycosyltransferase 61 catalytic domain-containing protein n=1 Tax=Polarella glacialis TaxID=89957 RepID=A0A813JR60_POLGL|nr:unnamed protein product [Polarella glacialis]
MVALLELLSAIQASRELCFDGRHTFEQCCDLRFGARGNSVCWREGFNYEKCCMDPRSILSKGCNNCAWLAPSHCLSHGRQRVDLNLSGKPKVDFPLESCLDLCCGLAMGASPERTHSASLVQGHLPSPDLFTPKLGKEPNSSTTRMGTSRRCHLHTHSVPFCEYKQLCLREVGANLAIVFLRHGESAGLPWRPLHVLPANVYPELALAGLPEEDIESVVLPHGFWWPPLMDNNDLKHQVGWSQPAEKIEQDIIWDGPGAGAVGSLILGLDPWFGPANLFHFAQLVMPAFAARVRMAWADGSGMGRQGGSLPRFDPVVLADPSGSSSLAWQRGFLDLVIGRSVTIIKVGSNSGRVALSAEKSSSLRCFRRAAVIGPSVRAHGATGSIDHLALLTEAAWQIPAVVVERRDVMLLHRSPAGKQGAMRAVVNEGEVVAAMDNAIRKISGQPSCRLASPCIVLHRGNQTFAQHVRLFAKSPLLVGVHGAGLVNMLFMPPQGVVMVLQPLGAREYYSAMAVGCGHYPIVFFVQCQPALSLPVRLGHRDGLPEVPPSARICSEDPVCKQVVTGRCHVHVDIPAFASTFEIAYAHAFNPRSGGSGDDVI